MSVSSSGDPSATGELTGNNDSQENDFEKPEYDSELKASKPDVGHGEGEVVEKKGESDSGL